MSEDVSIRGTLIPVDLGGLTVEEKAKSLIPNDEQETLGFYDSALEYLRFEMGYYYNIDSGILYTVESENLGEESYMVLDKGVDGRVDFQTRFYNGGTNLTEMLDEGFDELK